MSWTQNHFITCVLDQNSPNYNTKKIMHFTPTSMNIKVCLSSLSSDDITANWYCSFHSEMFDVKALGDASDLLFIRNILCTPCCLLTYTTPESPQVVDCMMSTTIAHLWTNSWLYQEELKFIWSEWPGDQGTLLYICFRAVIKTQNNCSITAWILEKTVCKQCWVTIQYIF